MIWVSLLGFIGGAVFSRDPSFILQNLRKETFIEKLINPLFFLVSASTFFILKGKTEKRIIVCLILPVIVDSACYYLFYLRYYFAMFFTYYFSLGIDLIIIFICVNRLKEMRHLEKE